MDSVRAVGIPPDEAPASLGRIPGVGWMTMLTTLGSGLRQSLGSFGFDPKHEAAVFALYRDGEPVEFWGTVWEGGRSREMHIEVIVTDLAPRKYWVTLTGTGAPYEG